MKIATVRSVCECQARLGADVDEHLNALRGWARDSRRRELVAPATARRSGGTRFDLGWFCPYCTRNVLRSFDSNALAFRDAPAPTASAGTPSKVPSTAPRA
jgi:hypothetical protein